MDIYDNPHIGEVVYVIYRNPHTQSVATIIETDVVNNEEGIKCLCMYDTYYPINNELAIFKSKEAAEQAYKECFGVSEEEGNG